MTDFGKYNLMDKIWATVYDYSTRDPISKPLKAVVQRLKDEGYTVDLLDGGRDFQIIKVDDEKFKIVRKKEWSKYDVLFV